MADNTHHIQSLSELQALMGSTTYVAVDFYADWCPPCKSIAPVYASLAGRHAVPGVLAFAKGLSRTYATEGVLVNCVSPAFIHTPMTDAMMDKRSDELGTSFDEAVESFLDEERPFMELKRRGEPEEAAAVVAFLCSDLASFVNGSNYRVDSGSVATI